MSQFYREITTNIPDLTVLTEEPMSRHTSFRIGGPAEYFVCPNREQIADVIRIAQGNNLAITVIGNGSNLLVGDKGIRGLVLEIGSAMSTITQKDNRMLVGAGALLWQVAAKAAEAELGGIEFAAGIPGSVGGAVTMNAGAYGGEMKDILRNVTVLTEELDIRTLSADEMDLSYRHSCVPENHFIVLEAEIELERKPKEEIRKEMEELRQKRVEKQPLEYPSAGSTFKRPEGYFAGKLIMDAGLRGYRVGDAQVSEKHCGFVINRGNATAAEVRRLMQDVQERVEEKFGVLLEPEVKMFGDF